MTLTNEDLLAISNLLDIKLKPIDQRLTNLEAEAGNLDNRITNLDNRITNLDNRITNLNNRITNLEVHIENVTDKNISLLAENYVPAARQFEKESYKIEALQADNDIIKKVLGEYSEKLEKIS